MATEITELLNILLYLFLAVSGGAMVAILAIVVIILMVTSGAWLLMQTPWFKKRDNVSSLPFR